MPEGWLRGKPVTLLMRQLMHDARDQDVIVHDGSREFYASLIIQRWGWLECTRVGDGMYIIQLTPLGCKALDDETWFAITSPWQGSLNTINCGPCLRRFSLRLGVSQGFRQLP
jgi:hypothetical protein